MKWLSVDVDIHNDPKVGRLIREEGHEAGWLYVVILAEIAKEIDFKNDRNGILDTGGDSPSVWLAWTQNISEKKAESFFSSCAEIGLIDSEKWEEGEVFVPKILERKQVKNFIKMQKRGSKGGEKSRKPEKTSENGKQNNPPSSPHQGGGVGGIKGSVTNKEEDEDRDVDKEKENHKKHREVFEFWNDSEAGVQHRSIDGHRSSINARLEDGFTVEELKEAISNLAEAYNSDDYYWSHKWTLKEFMSRQQGGKVEQFLDGIEEFKDDGGGNVNLPAPDELQDKNEGYWESVLPDCYADEDYPSMIYAEDVRKIAGMLDGHGEARAVKLLEEYFSEHDDKSELGDWLQEELDRGEKKQPV